MNKIKTIFFLLVISLFINPVSAQLLWNIEGNGLQQTSYLYGTMHIHSDGYLDFFGTQIRTLDESKSIRGAPGSHERDHFPAGTGAGIDYRKQLIKQKFAIIRIKKPDAFRFLVEVGRSDDGNWKLALATSSFLIDNQHFTSYEFHVYLYNH